MFKQCFICREFGWDVCRAWNGVQLCLPCYVDCLEVRERRGASVEGDRRAIDREAMSCGPLQEPLPRPATPWRQLDLFD